MNTDVLSDPPPSEFPSDFMPNDDFFEQPNDGPVPEWQDESMFNQEGGESLVDEARSLWWAFLTPLLLGIGLWFIWRTQVQGPNQFDPEMPSILFDRLQTWAQRLGLRSEPAQTPYEQASRFGRVLPEARRPIDSITQSYVQFRFNRRAPMQPAGTAQPLAEVPIEDPGPGDASWSQEHTTRGGGVHGPVRAWEEIKPLLWKAWLRRIFRWKQSSQPAESNPSPATGAWSRRAHHDFMLYSENNGNTNGGSNGENSGTGLEDTRAHDAAPYRRKYMNGTKQ